jgi:hypothetical protein
MLCSTATTKQITTQTLKGRMHQTASRPAAWQEQAVTWDSSSKHRNSRMVVQTALQQHWQQ